MKEIYRLTPQSKVIVTSKYVSGKYLYNAQHFKNGCSRGLDSMCSTDFEEVKQWIEKLRGVLNG